MGPLTYLCDGHMVYGYSFLVDLDILSPLVQVVFSFEQLQERYGSCSLFAAILPKENKIKHSVDKSEISKGARGNIEVYPDDCIILLWCQTHLCSRSVSGFGPR